MHGDGPAAKLSLFKQSLLGQKLCQSGNKQAESSQTANTKCKATPQLQA